VSNPAEPQVIGHLELELPPLADDERVPVNRNDDHSFAFFGTRQVKHWVEREVDGKWRLEVRDGLCRADAERTLEGQRRHLEEQAAKGQQVDDPLVNG
jgi:hypothetical protein